MVLKPRMVATMPPLASIGCRPYRASGWLGREDSNLKSGPPVGRRSLAAPGPAGRCAVLMPHRAKGVEPLAADDHQTTLQTASTALPHDSSVLWSACNAVWSVWLPVWSALIPVGIGGK